MAPHKKVLHVIDYYSIMPITKLGFYIDKMVCIGGKRIQSDPGRNGYTYAFAEEAMVRVAAALMRMIPDKDSDFQNKLSFVSELPTGFVKHMSYYKYVPLGSDISKELKDEIEECDTLAIHECGTHRLRQTIALMPQLKEVIIQTDLWADMVYDIFQEIPTGVTVSLYQQNCEGHRLVSFCETEESWPLVIYENAEKFSEISEYLDDQKGVSEIFEMYPEANPEED